jgi:hypothetical protein
MPFLPDHAGVLRPEEFCIVRNVYGRIVSEPWVSKNRPAHEQFAKYVLRMYDRGKDDPESLFRCCVIAAKTCWPCRRAVGAK